MTEQLYDGKLDGMELYTEKGSFGSSVVWEGLLYERRIDGRLYVAGSKWDLLPRKYDRL